MSRNARRTLVLAALVIVALGLAGVITGAIGSAFRGGEPLLPKPGVHLPAEEVFRLGGFTLTNTIISSWIATLMLIALFVLGTRRMRLVPGRFQSFLEMTVEALLSFVESVIGKERGRSFLPIIATIFLFVSFNAWLALLPIYPSLGFLDGEGHIERPLLRSAGTDLNMPLALALLSFVFVEGWGLRTLGWSYIAKFVRVGNLLRGRLFIGLMDLFVGFLEAFSELIRIVSFTFRLFGNMTAGEILLLLSAFLVSFVFTVPFYGLELLVGFVQALIFAGLTLVFAAVATTPHEHEEEHR